MADLVVDLGEAGSGTLRDEFTRALGDPSLQVGYWLPKSLAPPPEPHRESALATHRGCALLSPAPQRDVCVADAVNDLRTLAANAQGAHTVPVNNRSTNEHMLAPLEL